MYERTLTSHTLLSVVDWVLPLRLVILAATACAESTPLSVWLLLRLLPGTKRKFNIMLMQFQQNKSNKLGL